MLTVSAVPSIILAFLFGKWQSSRHVVSVLAEEVRVKGCEFGVSSMNILFELFLPVQYDSSWIFASGGEGHRPGREAPTASWMQPCLWMCTTSINFQQPSIACLWPPNESAWGNQSCWHCIWMRYDSSSMYYIYIIINLYRNNIYIFLHIYIFDQISINAMWDTVAQKCKTQKPFRTNVYKSSTTPYCKQQSLYLLRICCTRSSGQPCPQSKCKKVSLILSLFLLELSILGVYGSSLRNW